MTKLCVYRLAKTKQQAWLGFTCTKFPLTSQEWVNQGIVDISRNWKRSLEWIYGFITRSWNGSLERIYGSDGIVNGSRCFCVSLSSYIHTFTAFFFTKSMDLWAITIINSLVMEVQGLLMSFNIWKIHTVYWFLILTCVCNNSGNGGIDQVAMFGRQMFPLLFFVHFWHEIHNTCQSEDGVFKQPL